MRSALVVAGYSGGIASATVCRNGKSGKRGGESSRSEARTNAQTPAGSTLRGRRQGRDSENRYC